MSGERKNMKKKCFSGSQVTVGVLMKREKVLESDMIFIAAHP